MPSTLPSSTATTPRSSVELAKEDYKIETTSLASSESVSASTWQMQSKRSAACSSAPTKSSLWTAVKRHLKEHHDSVNAVYENTYGWAGGVRARSSATRSGATIEHRQGKAQEVWRYERGVYGRS
jgi:3-isopropylmalate dehydratase